jgi:phenylacetate-CoA ligase
MYPDQRAMLESAFPGVRVSSIGYASVDAGLLGYADPSCAADEHRVFDRETILEIVDEDAGAVIREPGRAGKVLLTNLTRKLMPVIRYPAGDRAMWVEPEGSPARKFRLLGRSEEAARVGMVSLYYEDVRQVIVAIKELEGAAGFQMALTHEGGKDLLTVRIAVAEPGAMARGLADGLREALFEARPLLRKAIDLGLIHPLRIEWVRASELAVNPRTGKLRRIVDQRF